VTAVKWTPGTWIRWLFGPTKQIGAVVVCPQCGRGMSIGGGTTFGGCHTVAADGTVSPSVVCGRCSWHTFIRLADWPATGGPVT
jgi:hypothetical protein